MKTHKISCWCNACRKKANKICNLCGHVFMKDKHGRPVYKHDCKPFKR